MEVPALPKDWLEASCEISRHLQKTREQRSRWEVLSIQKWINFLRDPILGGTWYRIEQRRRIVYGRFYCHQSPLTCKFESPDDAGPPTLEDLRRLELEEKVFFSENDIERMNACEIKVGRRKLVVPHPIYNDPVQKVEPEAPCRCRFATKGSLYRRHMKLGHGSPRIDPPVKHIEVRLNPNIRREDLLDSWKMIEDLRGSNSSATGQKKAAPTLARNMRWARMYAAGKSLSEIVTLELKSKAGYSWRLRYPSSTRSKIKKVIREALRKHGAWAASPSASKPVK